MLTDFIIFCHFHEFTKFSLSQKLYFNAFV